MKRSTFLVLGFLPALLTGCSTKDRDDSDGLGAPLIHMSGIVSPTAAAAPNHYVLADHLEIYTEKKDALTELADNSWQESSQILRIRVIQTCEETLYDYQAVIVPHNAERARWRVISADKGIELSSGAVWVWGIRPRVHTDWVTASSDSVMSGVGLDIMDSSSQRVFFIHGTYGARLTCAGSGGSRDFTAPGTYLDVGTDCSTTLSTPLVFPSTGPIRDRYTRLYEIAQFARWSP